MGRKKIKPDYSPEILGVNPFTAGTFEIKAVNVKTKRKLADVTDMLANSDAVITNIQEHTYNALMEHETYCKVFQRSGYRLHIGSLTPKARSLFLWIIYEMESGQDYLFINVDRYCLEFNVVYNTYRAALDELIRSGILSLSIVDKVYWVNPTFIFSGNRIKMYPENVRVIN